MNIFELIAILSKHQSINKVVNYEVLLNPLSDMMFLSLIIMKPALHMLKQFRIAAQ